MTYWWESTKDVVKLIERVFSANGNRVPESLLVEIIQLFIQNMQIFICEKEPILEMKI